MVVCMCQAWDLVAVQLQTAWRAVRWSSHVGQPLPQWAACVSECKPANGCLLVEVQYSMSTSAEARVLLAAAESSGLAAAGACLKGVSSHMSEPYPTCFVHSSILQAACYTLAWPAA